MKKFLFITLATLFLGIGIPSVSFAQDDDGPVQEFAKKTAFSGFVSVCPCTNVQIIDKS